MARARKLVTRAVAAGAAVAMTSTLVATGSVEAADAPLDCPDVEILDQSELEALAPGTPLVGLTVEAGDTPSEIDFVVEHVAKTALQDGAPLVVVRATSGSPVTDGKGIWFGMSGSPVYTVDGLGDPDQLVGAVAFGLSGDGASPIGGLQPAYQMELVRNYPTAGPSPTVVRLGPVGAERVAEATGAPVAQSSTLTRLDLPYALSTTHERAVRLIRRAARVAGMPIRPVAGGTATDVSAALAPATLEAGDTFVAAFSYGRVTAAATGTTTYVCGDTAMAFGHPFLYTGRQVAGANAGTDAFVVTDPAFGSYKMANVGGLAGRIDQDRAAGVRALLGEEVPLIPVTSSVHAPDIGQQSDAQTDVVDSAQASFLSLTHVLTHMDDVADHISEGSSRLDWTITGETEDNTPFELSRANRYTSDIDISFESVIDLLLDLEALENNPFTDVTFTGIDVGATAREDVHEYRVDRVRVKQGATYQEVRRLIAMPGEVLELEVRLDDGDGNLLTFERSLRVPADASGSGRLRVGSPIGGGFFFGSVAGGLGADAVGCIFGGCSGAPASKKATNLDEFIDGLEAQPRNDEVQFQLVLAAFDPEGGPVLTETTKYHRVDQVVRGAKNIKILVIG